MIPRYSRPEMAAIWQPETAIASGSRSRRMPPTQWPSSAIIPKSAAKKSGRRATTRNSTSRASMRSSARSSTTSSPFSPSRGDRRPRGALPASGHDLVRRARHLPGRSAPRAADMLLADVDTLLAALKRARFEHKMTPDDRPQPRHPCRADHFRPQAGLCLRRVRARRRAAGRGARRIATCAISGAVGTFAQRRSARRGARRREAGP